MHVHTILFHKYSDIATYKKLFTNSSPKFISPVPPDYDALPDNYTKVRINNNNNNNNNKCLYSVSSIVFIHSGTIRTSV